MKFQARLHNPEEHPLLAHVLEHVTDIEIDYAALGLELDMEEGFVRRTFTFVMPLQYKDPHGCFRANAFERACAGRTPVYFQIGYRVEGDATHIASCLFNHYAGYRVEHGPRGAIQRITVQERNF